MSQRQAEPITESATAKQRLVRNLSAYVIVVKDIKADNVDCVDHPSQTRKAGGQQSEHKASGESFVNVAGCNPMREQSKFKVQFTEEEFTTSDPTVIYQPTNQEQEPLKE